MLYSYPFGFNGQEKLDEISGSGNTYDLGMRMYSSRLGKPFSPDPDEHEYPWQSPYAYHRNSPIYLVDYMGLGDKITFNSFLLPPMSWSAHDKDAGILGRTLIVPTYKITAMTWNGLLGMGKLTFNINKYQFKVITGKTNPITDIKGVYNSTKNYFTKTPVKQMASQVGNFVADNWFEIGIGLATMRFASKPVGAGVLTEEAMLANAFKSGASKLMSTEQLAAYPTSTTFGNPTTSFVAPTAEIDALLNQGLTRVQIAEKLGITDKAFLSGKLVRVDIEASQLKNMNLKAPTGTEGGANSQFVLGGKTIGGVTEGVVDGIQKQGAGVTSKVLENH